MKFRTARAQGKRRLLSKFIVPYLIVLTIPLLIMVVYYFHSVKVVKEQSISLQLLNQHILVERMDYQVRQIDELILQLYMDEEIMSLSKIHGPDFSTSDMMILLKAIKRIGHFRNELFFNNDCFLIFPDNNVALSIDRLNTDLRFYYNNFFSYPDMSYEDWFSFTKGIRNKMVLPSRPVKVDSVEHTYISYLTPIPSPSRASTGTVAYFMIDTREIESILSTDPDQNPVLHIVDADGNVLHTNASPLPEEVIVALGGKNGFLETEIEGVPSLLVYTVSARNGWKYVTALPSSQVLGEVNTMLQLTTLLAVIAVLAGLSISLFFSRRTERPVSLLMSMLSSKIGESSNANVFEAIGSGVTSLLHANENMENKLAYQDKTLQALYVDRLLHDKAFSVVDPFADYHNPLFPFEGEGVTVAVLLLHCGLQSALFPQVVDIACTYAAERHPDIQYHAHTLNNNELALIVGMRGNDISYFYHRLASFAAELLIPVGDDIRASLRIAIGGAMCGIEKISDSYDQAQYALRYMFATNESALLWYKDISVETEKFFYPIDSERHLINNTKAGNAQELAALRDSLYKKNFIDVNLSIGMKKCLLYNLYSTYIKIAAGSDGTLAQVNTEFLHTIERHASDYDQIYHAIFSQLLQHAMQYEGAKKSHNSELTSQIKGYIAEHYSQWDLQIDTIAETFGISKPYLSSFFREQTGETFSSHLEKIRIHNASLLLQSGVSVSDAAEKVGYSNVHTFRRAFRRVMGILPSEYKET